MKRWMYLLTGMFLIIVNCHAGGPDDGDRIHSLEKYEVKISYKKSGKTVVMEFYNPDGMKHELKIFDTYGKLILSKITYDSRVEIDTGDLPENIKYNYVLKDNRGSYIAGKIDLTR